jgi:tartrate-resistant acid phosphatase type 5
LKSSILSSAAFLVALLVLPVVAHGEVAGLVAKLPADLRGDGALLLNESVEIKRALLADTLGKKDPTGTRDFLLKVLETETSARVRRAILDRVVRVPNADVMQALARHAASDPDPEIAIFALDRFRYERMLETRRLLQQRLALSVSVDNDEGKAMLAKEDERWISLVRGTMLPSFLQEPPPVFAVRTKAEQFRVLAFGDYGNGTRNQSDVASAMKKYHDSKPFDFGITLGDNFYSKGMLGTSDPHWKAWWSDMYDRIVMPFYATLGNHDWGYADSPAAEVMFTQLSTTWKMPATYYTFMAGVAQFFALDTNEMSRAQLAWLDSEIRKSTAHWKVVYGHHPIYSAGAHSDNPTLIKQLLPLLRNRVDVYIAGHDHDMQHLKTEAGVHFFVAGGAGAGLRKPTPGERTLFAQDAHGFSVLDIAPRSFQVRFLDTELKEIYSYSIQK